MPFNCNPVVFSFLVVKQGMPPRYIQLKDLQKYYFYVFTLRVKVRYSVNISALIPYIDALIIPTNQNTVLKLMFPEISILI